MTDTQSVCLDLFAGLGGFSQAFAADDSWVVVTVDKTETFERHIELDRWGIATMAVEDHYSHDIVADVFELTPNNLRDRIKDILGIDWSDIDRLVILASPPCTAFTQMAKGAGDGKGHVLPDGSPVTETGRNGIALAHHTVGLIRALNPDWWYLENPMGGMRNQLGKPDAHIWQCQYGEMRAKPTDLWGDHPPSFKPKRCWNGNDDCHHIPASRGSDSGTQASEYTSAERSKLPAELSKSILESVENPEPVQATLTEAAA